MVRPADYIHPEDEAARRNMEAIPGFAAAMKLFMRYYDEQIVHGMNMANKIRLSPTQLPEIYQKLPPICQRLSISEPEFYLEMDPYPNAYAMGDTRTMVTVTSGLLEYLDDEEVSSVIAHECGHIACRHMLYHTLASTLLRNIERMGILGNAVMPVYWALQYWSRRSELSADRAGAVALGSIEKVVEVQLRLAGGPREITQNVNVEEFVKQADYYDTLQNNTWDKLLQNYAILGASHPFTAIRVREILKWGKTEQCQRILKNIKLEQDGLICPNCGKPLLKSIRIYMQEKIIILDFGSQTTQLIGRRLRELNVYCEIVPYNKFPYGDESVKGVILSGSPFSVYDKSAFKVDLSGIRGKYPILGICYGAQFISYSNGGRVEPAGTREYGRAHLGSFDSENVLFKGVRKNTQVWMSHGDTITAIPDNFKIIASTDKVAIAAYQVSGEEMWGVQFHPEVFHSEDGTQMLRNFVVDVCGCSQSWSAASFVDTTVAELKEQLGNDRVILGLSGGVDSSVAAVLLHRAIGKNLTCIFVDHGLLRKNEFKNVMHDYECLGLNVIGVDASEKFFKDLEGVTEPEQKRKIIGRDFIEVFDAEAHKITDARWLAQGTIYPDRIESLNITGKTIKSHHNVGGLPEEMNLRLCEPLQWLFKDEVRRVGRELGMPEHLITRHPFPGPGLAVRILGDITPEKVHTLQEADDIFIQGLRDWKVQDADGNETSLYHQVWQAGVILLPVQSVGVMGDERTYERAVALRAVTSTDAMTADWAHLPYEFLGKVSNDIINKVKGVNRVTYDISSKPPSTIEWE